MIKKVLLDFGPVMDGALLAHVMDFCERAEAELTILNVFEPPNKSAVDYFRTQKQDLKQYILSTHESALAKILKKADIKPDAVRQEVRWGKDFIETVKLVQAESFDLVICATQEAGRTPDSTAMHLLRKCPCPVWMHRGHLWRGAVRILAAVNASDAAEGSDALDRKILDYALWLNTILHGNLHVLHCWKGYLESMINSPRFSDAEKAKYIDYERTQSEAQFARIMDPITLPLSAKKVMLYGDPAEIIPNYAEEKKMDIVVMGSVARSGIPGLLVGNKAERIVGALDCSVLAIKPDGFESPVR